MTKWAELEVLTCDTLLVLQVVFLHYKQHVQPALQVTCRVCASKQSACTSKMASSLSALQVECLVCISKQSVCTTSDISVLQLACLHFKVVCLHYKCGLSVFTSGMSSLHFKVVCLTYKWNACTTNARISEIINHSLIAHGYLHLMLHEKHRLPDKLDLYAT